MHEAAYGVVPHVFHSGLGLHLRHVPGLPPKEAKKAFKSFTRKAQVAKAPVQLSAQEPVLMFKEKLQTSDGFEP